VIDPTIWRNRARITLEGRVREMNDTEMKGPIRRRMLMNTPCPFGPAAGSIVQDLWRQEVEAAIELDRWQRKGKQR
jgi:hypothetical protein